MRLFKTSKWLEKKGESSFIVRENSFKALIRREDSGSTVSRFHIPEQQLLLCQTSLFHMKNKL
jgi:hypothetical protein